VSNSHDMVFRKSQEGTGGVRHRKILRLFGSTSHSNGKLPEQIQQQKKSAPFPQHQSAALPPTLLQHQKVGACGVFSQNEILQPKPPSQPREVGSSRVQQHRLAAPPSQPRQVGSFRTWQHQKKVLQSVPSSQPQQGSNLTQLQRQQQIQQPVPPSQPRETAPCTSHHRHLKDAVSHIWSTTLTPPTSPGKRSTQLRQEVLGSRQEEELEDPAAPHEPSPGTSYRSLVKEGSACQLGHRGAAPQATCGAEVLDRSHQKSMDCWSQGDRHESSESHPADIKYEITQHNETHEMVAQFLTRAVHDGSLESIISDIEQKAVQHASSNTQKRGAQLLAQAGNRENLDNTVSESEQEDTSFGLCGKDANLLMQAIQNGSLESICSKLEEETRQNGLKHIQGIPTKLFRSEADHDGCFETRHSGTREMTQKDTSGIREICADLLTQAIHDGRLECILESLEETTQHISDGLPAGGHLLAKAANDVSVKSVLMGIDIEACSEIGFPGVGHVLTSAANAGSLESVLLDINKEACSGTGLPGAGHLLAVAANNGSLESILMDIKKEASHETSLPGAGHLLAIAAIDGSLENILLDIKEEARSESGPQGAALLLTRAANDGSLERILMDIKNEVSSDTALFGADLLLTKATKDGSLKRILMDVKKESCSKSRLPGDGRLLTNAANDGSLESISVDIKREALSETSLPGAGHLLTKAANDGSLESILMDIKKESCSETGCSGLGNVLTRAANDGSLESILMDIKKESSPENSLPGAGHLLTKAATDGSLDIDCVDAAECLVRALHDGSLENVLTAILHENATAPMA